MPINYVEDALISHLDFQAAGLDELAEDDAKKLNQAMINLATVRLAEALTAANHFHEIGTTQLLIKIKASNIAEALERKKLEALTKTLNKSRRLIRDGYSGKENKGKLLAMETSINHIINKRASMIDTLNARKFLLGHDQSKMDLIEIYLGARGLQTKLAAYEQKLSALWPA